ncbi:MEDS domain-containing protein [Geomonas sp. RF6]|uniref:MEDS domain-containing protein n=1 Tax=Geomonas sp. RF6 TaxID=2897342 RepID=UPI001E57A5CE|nr:MEDS domain-containing protein [Geomonas sp. RF6]UFS69233.1 MEDS domain-containing protein [Geomonas sp. RF6]
MADKKEVTADTLTFQEICRHDHLSLFFHEEEETVAPVTEFIQGGLALGERCVGMNLRPELQHLLVSGTTSPKQRAAVIMLSKEESFLRGGAFHGEKMLRFLGSLCLTNGTEGFKGTRLICDMGWVVREEVGHGRLTEFEAHLNYLAADHELTIMCLYDRALFPPELLLEIAKIHSHLHLGGKVCRNSFFIAPDRYLVPTRRSSELEIFLNSVEQAAGLMNEQEKLRRDLEQAHATLAQKICEVWREEDALRRSELQLHEKNEALQDYKRRIQTILQHIPLMLGAFDSKNRLVACNHEYELVTGFRAEEVMGKRIVELLLLDGAARDEMLAAHPSDGGNYRDREWPIACKDGSLRQVSWSNISSFVRIPGWNNWIVGLDITDRVQAENTVKVLNDQLRVQGGGPLGFGVDPLSEAGSPRQPAP